MEPPDPNNSDAVRRHLNELVPSSGGAVTGTLIGLAVGGPAGAVIGSGLGEILGYIGREALTRRRQRATRALEVAAVESGMTPQTLLDHILDDEQLLELAAAVIAAAAETALEMKVRVLGQALARGTLANDDATIDQERFMVGTLAALEAPHLQVLDRISRHYKGFGQRAGPNGQTQAHGWTFQALASRLPGLRPVLRPVLGALTAHALIFDTAVGTWGYSTGKSERWIVTDYGRRFVRLLEVRAETSLGS